MPKVSEIVRKIKKETNCYILNKGTKHEAWLNPETNEVFRIPRHYSKELPAGTLNSILKNAGLK